MCFSFIENVKFHKYYKVHYFSVFKVTYDITIVIVGDFNDQL